MKARIDIITTSLSEHLDFPNYSYHYSFWAKGKKWRTTPKYGFASAVAAREEAERRMNEAKHLRVQIVKPH